VSGKLSVEYYMVGSRIKVPVGVMGWSPLKLKYFVTYMLKFEFRISVKKSGK